MMNTCAIHNTYIDVKLDEGRLAMHVRIYDVFTEDLVGGYLLPKP